ncbi:MAG TPA: nitroreductase family protein [Candidatus Sulfotelmatobacter sp.]|nr:nitroreductase family protein [Candidatus Sulfotelmatobacter sp.]
MTVDYSREHVMSVDPTILKAMITERGHHTVEIQLYEALAKSTALGPTIGKLVRELLATWQERGLPPERGELVWVRTLLEMAGTMQRGGRVDLSRFACPTLDANDRKVVERLLFERRSVRHWTEEEVPDWMIDEILRAGLWAAHGCNLNSLRFLVVREKSEPDLFRGADIPGGPVHLVACQDRRVYYVQPGYVKNPDMLEKNRVLDCGAAMQNMVLMAHALGLGGCWLTFRNEMVVRIRARFQLPDHIEIVTYMDVGFPNQTPMPPGRMSVAEAVLIRR